MRVWLLNDELSVWSLNNAALAPEQLHLLIAVSLVSSLRHRYFSKNVKAFTGNQRKAVRRLLTRRVRLLRARACPTGVDE